MPSSDAFMITFLAHAIWGTYLTTTSAYKDPEEPNVKNKIKFIVKVEKEETYKMELENGKLSRKLIEM